MSAYVNEEIARDAQSNGVFIGRTEPARETKGSWWQVYRHNGKLIACVNAGFGALCGEEISEKELNMYVDSPKESTP